MRATNSAQKCVRIYIYICVCICIYIYIYIKTYTYIATGCRCIISIDYWKWVSRMPSQTFSIVASFAAFFVILNAHPVVGMPQFGSLPATWTSQTLEAIWVFQLSCTDWLPLPTWKLMEGVPVAETNGVEHRGWRGGGHGPKSLYLERPVDHWLKKSISTYLNGFRQQWSWGKMRLWFVQVSQVSLHFWIYFWAVKHIMFQWLSSDEVPPMVIFPWNKISIRKHSETTKRCKTY